MGSNYQRIRKKLSSNKTNVKTLVRERKLTLRKFKKTTSPGTSRSIYNFSGKYFFITEAGIIIKFSQGIHESKINS